MSEPLDVATPPVLATPRIRLRQVQPGDYPVLHQLETTSDLAWRWRQRGRTLSPEEFVHGMWQNVHAQFIVERVANTLPVGLVVAYDLNERDGLCRVGLLKFDLSAIFDPSFILGAAIFLDYLFYYWPIRKVYAESVAHNVSQFASGVDSGLLKIEGRLTDYSYRDGRYDDVLIVSLDRVVWQEKRLPFIRLAMRQ